MLDYQGPSAQPEIHFLVFTGAFNLVSANIRVLWNILPYICMWNRLHCKSLLLNPKVSRKHLILVNFCLPRRTQFKSAQTSTYERTNAETFGDISNPKKPPAARTQLFFFVSAVLRTPCERCSSRRRTSGRSCASWPGSFTPGTSSSWRPEELRSPLSQVRVPPHHLHRPLDVVTVRRCSHFVLFLSLIRLCFKFANVPKNSSASLNLVFGTTVQL